MPRCWTSSANSVGVQCVTERPLSAGGSQATASSWAICSAVNLPGHPGRGKSLNNSSRARGKAAAFSQHSIRTRRWNAAAQRRRQMPTACRSQPRWSAIAWLSQPPNASKIMWARWARACGQVLERVRVCRTSCWRSVIMTLAALPGMARTSPSVGEIGGLGKYRKTRAIVEASFSQGVLVELAADPIRRAQWGAAGRARAAAHFDQKRMIADYRRICLLSADSSTDVVPAPPGAGEAAPAVSAVDQ